MATFWNKFREFTSPEAYKNRRDTAASWINNLLPVTKAVSSPGQVQASPAPAPAPSTDFYGGGSSGGYGAVGGWEPTTNVMTGGGSISGGGGGQQPPMGQAPMEQDPGQPSIDFDAMFAPAFQALQQQEAASQGLYESGVQEVETGTAQRKEELKGEETRRMGEYGQQRGREEKRTGSAISEARRQAAELMQGIQSRYGGTTHLGQARSEVLGGQATRNIAMNRASLQETLGQIGQAESNLQDEVMRMSNAEDQRLESSKVQLRAELQQSLANIASERGRLESEKAQMRLDTLGQYKQVLAGIDQRNTAFKQQLFVQQQQAQQQIESLKAKATQNYQAAVQPFQAYGIQGSNQSYAYVPKAEGMTGIRLSGDEDDLSGLLPPITGQ